MIYENITLPARGEKFTVNTDYILYGQNNLINSYMQGRYSTYMTWKMLEYAYITNYENICYSYSDV